MSVNAPKIKLRDGNSIPQLGLGTWQVTDESQLDAAIAAALDIGYRHIDTAQVYHNEELIGRALKKSSIKREDLFITTKIDIRKFRPRDLQDGFAESLKALQTDYVDLLLLHFPVTLLRKKAWLELEKIKAQGRTKSIGVSNYMVRHLDEMASYANEKPVVNQVELHVFLQQLGLIEHCQDEGIVVEAYSPLARAHIMDNPAVQSIADKHSKTYAEIMLRWLVQMGLVVIPKSTNAKRVAENANIFDFALDDEDMDLLAKQDKDKRFCWSPVHVP
jgi:diketogulonate reductase-like aldo/keto reductase